MESTNVQPKIVQKVEEYQLKEPFDLTGSGVTGKTRRTNQCDGCQAGRSPEATQSLSGGAMG